MGSRFLLHGIFPTQWLNSGLLHCWWILYPLRHQGRPRSESRRVYFTELFYLNSRSYMSWFLWKINNHFLICCLFSYLFSLFWDGQSALRLKTCWNFTDHSLLIYFTMTSLKYIYNKIQPLSLQISSTSEFIDMVAFFLIGLKLDKCVWFFPLFLHPHPISHHNHSFFLLLSFSLFCL